MTADSELKEFYASWKVKNAEELFQLFHKEDQVLMDLKLWDYTDPNLITNNIRKVVENLTQACFEGKDGEFLNLLLGFWYHHAISCALFKKKDRLKAQEFALQAMKYYKYSIEPDTAFQYNGDTPITYLLYLLSHNKVSEAEQWIHQIKVDKETAIEVLEWYKQILFDL